MAINKGSLASYNVDQTSSVSSNWDSAVGAQADLRRIHDFSDKVHELAPEESPFFVYLTQMSKNATNDPVFRFLENRSKIDWTTRTMLCAAAVNGGSAVAADSSYAFSVDDGSASIDWLIKGMVFAVNTTTGGDNTGQATVRIETAPVDAGTSTTFTGKVLSLANGTSDGENVATDNDKCMVIGTSFEEGSGSPDVWSGQMDDDFGYTQIFKTAAEMSNTAIATKYRGYANEWQRIWNLKLREHKVDIERAMLFSQQARSGNNQLTDGLVGHIIRTVTPTNGTANFSYSRGSSYFKTSTGAELTYDVLLGDMEILFDPARGGSANKLCLAGLPVVSYFNKLGSAGFIYNSTTADRVQAKFDIENRTSAFGHKIMELETIHGSLSIVKEPLFRGYASGLMAICDMNHLSYRPLVGNGLNRDTHIITNVQQADEDLRKDMILTEAGLEVTIPESHALYSFEDL